MKAKSLEDAYNIIAGLEERIIYLERKVEALEKENLLKRCNCEGIQKKNDEFKGNVSLDMSFQENFCDFVAKSRPFESLKKEVTVPKKHVSSYNSPQVNEKHNPIREFHSEMDSDLINCLKILIEEGIKLNQEKSEGHFLIPAFDISPAEAIMLKDEIIEGKKTIKYYLGDLKKKYSFEQGKLIKSENPREGYQFTNVRGLKLNGKVYPIEKPKK